MPATVIRPFDYSPITDVVLTMRYTSCEGGESLRTAASESIKNFAKTTAETSRNAGLFALFNLKTDHAVE